MYSCSFGNDSSNNIPPYIIEKGYHTIKGFGQDGLPYPHIPDTIVAIFETNFPDSTIIETSLITDVPTRKPVKFELESIVLNSEFTIIYPIQGGTPHFYVSANQNSLVLQQMQSLILNSLSDTLCEIVNSSSYIFYKDHERDNEINQYQIDTTLYWNVVK